MKKIGLIDADLMDNGTRHPNLALMKIAGYYRELGNTVELIYKSYNDVKEFDKVFISKVFNFTSVPKWVIELPNVEYGGTGFFEDGGENLRDEIEHHMPYYDLYKDYVEEQLEKGRKRKDFSDYLDYSIGFTTRGCFRKCSFCVNKKYDNVKRHSPVNEFFDQDRPYIYLWDDNILAYPNWEEILDSIESTERQFQFRQGLDLRLMTNKKAKRFNNTSYQGDFIFAFDSLEDRELISDKVQLWKRYSSKVCKMYVLCGFNSQDEKDIEDVFKRIKILMKYGSLPYIMRFEAYKESRFRGMYIELARWCNQPQFFKKKSFREFCEVNQAYKKNQDNYCASYRAMIEFEKEFPQIAEKYFDLKFEEENMYSIQYGYGRKYQNKPLCKDCKKKSVCWEQILSSNDDEDIEKKFIELYFTKEIDLLCLNYENKECNVTGREAAIYLKDILLKYSINEIIDIIKNAENKEEVHPDNIPQMSEFTDAAYNVIDILLDSQIEKMNFLDMGYYLRTNYNPNSMSKLALKKYGENHTKIATLMDLTHIGKQGISSYIRPTELGKVFYDLDKSERENIACKLLLRIPILSNAMTIDYSTIEDDIKVLSVSTQKRRRSNVSTMLKLIEEGKEKF